MLFGVLCAGPPIRVALNETLGCPAKLSTFSRAASANDAEWGIGAATSADATIQKFLHARAAPSEISETTRSSRGRYRSKNAIAYTYRPNMLKVQFILLLIKCPCVTYA